MGMQDDLGVNKIPEETPQFKALRRAGVTVVSKRRGLTRASKCSTLRIYANKKYTGLFVSSRCLSPTTLYEPATSFSKTTLAFNKTSMR